MKNKTMKTVDVLNITDILIADSYTTAKYSETFDTEKAVGHRILKSTEATMLVNEDELTDTNKKAIVNAITMDSVKSIFSTLDDNNTEEFDVNTFVDYVKSNVPKGKEKEYIIIAHSEYYEDFMKHPSIKKESEKWLFGDSAIEVIFNSSLEINDSYKPNEDLNTFITIFKRSDLSLKLSDVFESETIKCEKYTDYVTKFKYSVKISGKQKFLCQRIFYGD